jgi:hypothetical protein
MSTVEGPNSDPTRDPNLQKFEATQQTGKDSQGREITPSSDPDGKGAELFTAKVAKLPTEAEVQEQAYKTLQGMSQKYIYTIIELKKSVRERQLIYGDKVDAFDPLHQEELLQARKEKASSMNEDERKTYISNLEQLNNDINHIKNLEEAQSVIGNGLDLLDLLKSSDRWDLSHVSKCEKVFTKLSKSNLTIEAELFLKALPIVIRSLFRTSPDLLKTSTNSSISSTKAQNPPSIQKNIAENSPSIKEKKEKKKVTFGPNATYPTDEPSIGSRSFREHHLTKSIEKSMKKLDAEFWKASSPEKRNPINQCLRLLFNNLTQLTQDPENTSLDADIIKCIEHPHLDETCRSIFLLSLPKVIRERLFSNDEIINKLFPTEEIRRQVNLNM